MPALGRTERGICWDLLAKRGSRRGPASHRRFLGRPVSGSLRGLFPSRAACFPSLRGLWPLRLSKTPGVRMLPASIPTGSGGCSGGIAVAGLGCHGSPHYCWLVSSWASWQAIVGLCNQNAEAANHITGHNEEFDPCDRLANCYSHLLLFLPLPWSKDPFRKKEHATSTV